LFLHSKLHHNLDWFQTAHPKLLPSKVYLLD
jgi:hypothetical protein